MMTNSNNDMVLVKTATYTGVAGGNMGTISRKYVAGNKNTYQKDGFIIDEFVPRNDLRQNQTITYVVTGFADDESLSFDNSIDWSKVNNKVLAIRNQELRVIESTGLTTAIQFMAENKAGFIKIIEHIQCNYNLPKPLAFLNVIKDFYNDYSYIFTIEVIAKIMIKYGYDFKSLKEIRNLYYN